MAITAPVRHRREMRAWAPGHRRLPTRLGAGWPVDACVLLALALRAPYLGIPLGRDEGGLVFIARQWPGGHGSLYGAYWLDRPPLLVALFKLAGGELGVRLLGAAAATALVVAVAAVGREVGGERAGRVAALLAALLTGTVAIGAVLTPAELLAAVPSALSVLCLLRGRHLFLAGLLAAAALLIKQSFIDAGAAGIVFLALRRPRGWPAYAAGAALPLAVLAVPGYADALIGFRLHALHTLAGSNISLPRRLAPLAPGLVAAGAIAGAGLRRVPDRAIAATLATWFAGGAAGVLAGGSYWSHYLIQLVPVTCVAAGLLRPRAAILAAASAVAIVVAGGGAVYVHANQLHRAELTAGRYVRDHARPGDTQYVMYARANVLAYAGLPSPYPYAWSLMVRARPGAIPRLRRLLASPRRPTWVVGWQPPGAWGLDRDGRTARLLTHGYRRAAVIDGHPIYRAR